ncbi:MAG: hypothetical protein SWH78_16710 [Thermodesulfobacteriota bacterium]|nr:hypothetical protein [Thermodesulfobacteriota bacterium]
MTTQLSFSKYEQEIRPILRRSINSAESTEDVKKFFFYGVRNLLKKVLQRQMSIDHEDILLDPKEERGFTISSRVWDIPAFASAWRESDLPHIIERMAEFAINRYKHLDKHPDKTEAKMYPIPG